MTNNSNPLNIVDFDKVCKVSSIISQICQIRGLDWWEKTLLDQWEKTLRDKQESGGEAAFILAKWAFIYYLRSDRNVMLDDPVTPFLSDCIKHV